MLPWLKGADLCRHLGTSPEEWWTEKPKQSVAIPVASSRGSCSPLPGLTCEHKSPTVVLEKTLDSPMDSKEVKPVNPKGNQPWKFIGRTDAEAPILCPPDGKSWLIEKTLMLGKTEDEGRRGRQRVRWLDGVTNSVDMNSSKLREIVKDGEAWQAAVYGIEKSGTRATEQQQNYCPTKTPFLFPFLSFFVFFLPVLLIYDWHTALYQFKVYSVMIWLTRIVKWS